MILFLSIFRTIFAQTFFPPKINFWAIPYKKYFEIMMYIYRTDLIKRTSNTVCF